MYSFFKNLLPDLLHTIEDLMGPGNGAAKQDAVIALITEGLTLAGLPTWIVAILVGITKALIPMLVAKYNADPANTTFVKPPTA